MSDSAAFGFGKFIPGFDFLQQLGKAGSASGVPPLSHWVAPTVSVEEISKRIEELKAVQFWLEQNSRALAATVQALEVQKMTLHTLQGMNVSMADLAKSFAASGQTMPGAGPAAAGAHADWPMSSEGAKHSKKAATAKPAPEKPSAAPEKPAKPAAADAAHERSAADKADTAAGAAAGMADPMLWWGALSQQFQQIAGQALQDPAQQQAMAKATHMATDFTKAAMQAASAMARQATEGVKAATDAASAARRQAPQASAAARKTAAKPAAQPAAKPQAAAKPAAKKPAPAKKATARTTGTRAAKPVAGRR